MIEKIFEFLTVRERLTASLTCKKWHQLAFSPKFSKKMRIRIYDRHYRSPLPGDIAVCQKFRNAYISLDEIYEEFPNEIADFIKTAPLESLEIYCYKQSIKQILDDHLLSMKALTKLIIRNIKEDPLEADDALRINHPNLKYVAITYRTKYQSFEINCPNLIDLKLQVNYDETNFNLVTQLQHQLQCLELECNRIQHIEAVTNAELSNLKKLCVRWGIFQIAFGVRGVSYNSPGPRIEPSFDRMVNLIELQLFSPSCDEIIVGEQLGVLTCLSKLTLSKITLNAQGFAKALLKMVDLKDLELTECKFTESCHIESEHVENLKINFKSVNCSILLPHFPNLRRLSFANFFNKNVGYIFAQICDIYPKIEKLRFEAFSGFNETPSTTSFSHIRKLKFLKDLHLIGLSLDDIDWKKCNEINVLKLHLTLCVIEDNVAQHLVTSIGRRLRWFILSDCSLKMTETRAKDLLKSWPWCVVFLENCCLMEKCQYEDLS